MHLENGAKILKGAHFMKLFNLLNQCDKEEVYLYLRKNKNLSDLTKKEFSTRLSEFLHNYEENKNSDYYIMYIPYIMEKSSQTERDIFVSTKTEIDICANKPHNHIDMLLMTSRLPCDTLSADELLNAEICPLSYKTFGNTEICAEFFFDALISVENIQKFENKKPMFIENIHTGINIPIPQRKEIPIPDIKTTIQKNVCLSYPYYISVSNVKQNS